MLVDAIGILNEGEIAHSTNWTQIAVSAIVTFGTIVTAWFAYRAATNSRNVKSRIESLDKSVNGVPPGTLPLIRRVDNLERRTDSHARWMVDALERIGDQLGVPLPDRRDYDPEVEA